MILTTHRVLDMRNRHPYTQADFPLNAEITMHPLARNITLVVSQRGMIPKDYIKGFATLGNVYLREDLDGDIIVYYREMHPWDQGLPEDGYAFPSSFVAKLPRSPNRRELIEEYNARLQPVADDLAFWCRSCKTVVSRHKKKAQVFRDCYCTDCYDSDEKICKTVDESRRPGFYD